MPTLLGLIVGEVTVTNFLKSFTITKDMLVTLTQIRIWIAIVKEEDVIVIEGVARGRVRRNAVAEFRDLKDTGANGTEAGNVGHDMGLITVEFESLKETEGAAVIDTESEAERAIEAGIGKGTFAKEESLGIKKLSIPIKAVIVEELPLVTDLWKEGSVLVPL